jgi:hypothetical protein
MGFMSSVGIYDTLNSSIFLNDPYGSLDRPFHNDQLPYLCFSSTTPSASLYFLLQIIWVSKAILWGHLGNDTLSQCKLSNLWENKWALSNFFANIKERI